MTVESKTLDIGEDAEDNGKSREIREHRKIIKEWGTENQKQRSIIE